VSFRYDPAAQIAWTRVLDLRAATRELEQPAKERLIRGEDLRYDETAELWRLRDQLKHWELRLTGELRGR